MDMRRTTTDEVRAGVAYAALAATIAGTLAGCASATPQPVPRFDGPVEACSVNIPPCDVYDVPGTAVRAEYVRKDGAKIGVYANRDVEYLELGIGDEAEALGIHVRLCGTWIDTDDDVNLPGGDESTAYYVVGTGDHAPECPARTN
jgi:hypothetical protein